jgi:hypothetical protein
MKATISSITASPMAPKRPASCKAGEYLEEPMRLVLYLSKSIILSSSPGPFSKMQRGACQFW